MPPLQDDRTIEPAQGLIRALHRGWTAIEEDGRERPNRLAFTDRSQETSCFIETPENLAELRRQFPGEKICRFTAGTVRAVGFVIERKPQECRAGFAEANDHVVIGPPEVIPKKDLMKLGDRLAKTPGVEILDPVDV